MESIIEEFCERLASIDAEDDELMSHLYEATDLLENESDISNAFDSIFNFIESNPESDLGAPGPLVHLLEDHYPKYTPRLIESLENRATYTTVFMLSRILNSDLAPNIREQYLSLLKGIAGNENADSMAREQAKEFYEHHTN